VIVAAMTFVAAKNLPGLLEIMLLQRLPLDTGSRYAVTTVARYSITIVGLVFAFGTIGIRWSTIQWLAAAITVGLGFGMQEIFANFVSGLILLFERPIRVGDVITVGNTDGTVTRIQMRATTIMDWNRKEIIIPNKEFVTGQIVNWSLSDRVLRLVCPVGIAYGADTRKAVEILLRVATQHPRVLAQPEPRALFVGFGASSLDFELRVFLKDIDDLVTARHELLLDIDDSFRKAGIEIPFPQRDLHVRSIQPSLRVEYADCAGAVLKRSEPSTDA
jgi:potassium efflux system protein